MILTDKFGSQTTTLAQMQRRMLQCRRNWKRLNSPKHRSHRKTEENRGELQDSVFFRPRFESGTSGNRSATFRDLRLPPRCEIYSLLRFYAPWNGRSVTFRAISVPTSPVKLGLIACPKRRCETTILLCAKSQKGADLTSIYSVCFSCACNQDREGSW
jgi:hypothetical protein